MQVIVLSRAIELRKQKSKEELAHVSLLNVLFIFN